MIQRLETDATRDEKDNRRLLHQKEDTDWRKEPKCSDRRGETPSGTRDEIRCRYLLGGNCTSLSCNFWHPPVCLNYKSESDCTYDEKYRFRHVETDGQPSKKSNKSGAKDLLKEYNWFVCLKILIREKSIPRKKRKLGSNHTVNFSKGTWHHIKIQERKDGSSWSVIQKCEPHERNSCAPEFEERTQVETLYMGLDEKYVQAQKKRIKLRFTIRLKSGQRRRPLQNLQRIQNLWLTLEHQCKC